MSDNLRRHYVIGLGANLGDRRATLRSALFALEELGRLVEVSSLYESPAVGPPQPDYLNAAVLLSSLLGPFELLAGLARIEQAHGRERRVRWGPRTLDLDLLYGPELEVNEPELTVPHPELAKRAFALVPLLDVAPEAREPGSGARYADLLAGVERGGLRLLETRRCWCPGRVE